MRKVTRGGAINPSRGVMPRRFARTASGTTAYVALIRKTARFMPWYECIRHCGSSSLNASRKADAAGIVRRGLAQARAETPANMSNATVVPGWSAAGAAQWSIGPGRSAVI